MTHKYDPDYAVHPGETVKECMEMHRCSAMRIAKAFGTPDTHWRVTENLAGEIVEIALGRRSIEEKHALAFYLSFKVSVEFWLDLQENYDKRQTGIQGKAYNV